jgi:hypothetical protein
VGLFDSFARLDGNGVAEWILRFAGALRMSASTWEARDGWPAAALHGRYTMARLARARALPSAATA